MNNFELKSILNKLSEILIYYDKCPEDEKLLIEYFDNIKLLNYYSEILKEELRRNL